MVRHSKRGIEHVRMPSYVDPTNVTHDQVVTPGVARTDPTTHDDSFPCRAREHATTVPTVALPIAEAVPIVGSPMKAAIGGLLAVLNIVDVRACNPYFFVCLDDHLCIL